MIRNYPIKAIQTSGGERYVYGPKTYRHLAEAEAAKAAHEAEYDRHIAEYHRQYDEAQVVMKKRLADAGLDDTTENREKLIRLDGYRNILRATGGDKVRAAQLYAGKYDSSDTDE